MMKLTAILVAGLALVATDARADIVVFKNGRTMSVKSYRVDADTATMTMREGGEVTFPASIVARVDPDEVPYPEPLESHAERDTAAVPLAQGIPVELPRALVSEEVLAARPFAG